MKRIVVMGLGLALALPCAAGAQPAAQGPGGAALPGQPPAPGTSGPSGSGLSPNARGALLGPAVPAAGLTPGGGAPAGQRPPRPENALGPDLAGAIFAPIGVIVAPFTEGLHAFDAAIAPINEALQPITGPYGAALVVGPDGAPVPPEAAVEPVPAVPAPAPARIGPRK